MKIRSSTKTIIGLTGGIASGKTVASEALQKSGFSIIDADVISRAVTAHGSDAEKELMLMFPSATRNGALDRKALRAQIALDRYARDRLNAYLHPIITEAVKNEIAAARSPVVLSAPLLFEVGLDKLCDCVVCIDCPREKRIERIIKRDGSDRQTAIGIIDAQISDEARAVASDYCVSSDCDICEFESNITALFRKIVSNA